MREAVRDLLPYLARHRERVALGIGALLLKDVFAAVMPLMIKNSIDSLTTGFRMDRLILFTAALVGLSAVKGVFQYWMRVILISLSRDIEYDMRNDLFARLVTLSGDFYARLRTGDIMARATNDLNAVRMMLGPGVMYTAETALVFPLALAVMGSVDWQLTLITLLPAPLVSVAVLFYGRAIHARFEKIQALFSDISSRVQENLAGVRVIRAYAQEEAEMKRFASLNRDYIAQNMRLVRMSGTFMPIMQGLIGLSFLLVLWAGGYRVLSGKITLGTFLMFNFYMGMLVWPIVALGWVVNILQRGSASLKRLNQVLVERPSIAAPARPRPLEAPRGEIELRNVSVRFPGGGGLRDLSLHIPAGYTVAIVGHTGSGKSTLVHLIPRLLDPVEGSVRFDGVDVREYDPADLRRAIGLVPQETFLFSSTLAENIAFGVSGASEEEIRDAAERAGLGPDVAAFPDGYRTVIGERGITLSGGQKQRTAIARAILRRPAVLILDDALSSVDTLTEDRILSGLTDVMRERTTILISHRVSTVRHADRIFVVENGALAEQGTHAELLLRGGFYADLHQRQLLEEELETI
jgi:ATP-binding cassette subfamily B multidrug efflux pump